MKEMKRIISLLLCLVMLVGYLPVNARAEEAMTTEPSAVETAEETAAETTEETEPEKPGKPAGPKGPGKHEKPGKPEHEKPETTEATVPVTEETVPETTEATVPVTEETVPETTEATVPATEETVPETTEETEPVMMMMMAAPRETAPEPVDAAIFFSDLHTSKYDYKESTVKGVMNGLKNSNLNFSSVTSCGDAFSVNEDSSKYTGDPSKITGYIRSVFTDIPVSYVWSDHDRYAGLDNDSGFIYGAGADGTYGTADDGNYYIYELSMADLSTNNRYNAAFHSNEDVTATIAAFVEDAAELDQTKPLFIASHQPLLDRRNDNGHALKWANAINKVAETMDVAFFFGHNHKYDVAGDYYYAKGSTMPVATTEIIKEADGKDGLEPQAVKLNFTHMCTGYLAPSSTGSTSNTTREGTAMAVTIFEDSISYVTYNKDGIYTGSYALNVTVDRDHAEAEDSGNSGEVKKDEATGITVAAPGITGLTASALTAETGLTAAQTAVSNVISGNVVAYDIRVEGFVNNSGTKASVTIPIPSGMAADKFVVYHVAENGEIEEMPGEASGQTYTFETDHFSVYVGGEKVSDNTQVDGTYTGTGNLPGATVYKLDTDGVEKDAKYLIVNKNSGDAFAFRNNNSNRDKTGVKITDGTVRSGFNNEEVSVWTFTASDNKWYIANGNQQIRLNDKDILDGDGQALTVSHQGKGAYIIQGDRYLRYGANNWERSRTSSNVYLFKQETTAGTSVTFTLEAPAELTTNDTTYDLTYKIELGQGTVSSKEITWTSDNNAVVTVANGVLTVKGEGTANIKAKLTRVNGTGLVEAIELTVPVTVSVKRITGIKIVPETINVFVGTNLYKKVATLVVTYEGGTTREEPLTLHDLGDHISTDEAGEKFTATVTRGDQTATATVNVIEMVVNNYPEYPDEGAVKVSKTGTGVQFQSSGIAQVEIAASGVPMKRGVDVIVMLDTSTSMARCIHCGKKKGEGCNCGSNYKSRIAELNEALDDMIDIFGAKNPDGTDQDIRIAIRNFNGTGSGATAWDKNDRSADEAGIGYEGVHVDYTGSGLGAGAFVSVSENYDALKAIKVKDADMMNGTNYDYAFDAIYQMGHAIQKANEAAGENRDLFVIFMSDGAPNYYNYYATTGGSGGSEVWEYWLAGAIGQNVSVVDIDGTVVEYKSKTFRDVLGTYTTHSYYYDATTGNQHRMARAVKGSPDEKYEVIRKAKTGLEDVLIDLDSKDANYGKSNMYKLPGLGATMYSVAFTPANDGPIDRASMLHVLRNIATSTEKHYYEATDSGALANAFKGIAGDIAYAANNARFVDQMGANYNLKMGALTDLNKAVLKDETGKEIQNKIEILEYSIYTKDEADASSTDGITAAMIGDRKPTAPKVLETVTFSADGKTATSTLDSVGPDGAVIPAGQNILIGNVIYAKYFYYNNNHEGVTISDVAYPTGVNADGTTRDNTNVLPAETFYWKMGTVKTTELAMRYYVYLDGTMEGTREGGSYPTNEFATLYYDNYVGKPCKKDTVSPVLAWKEANVSYAFYLVNENGEIIVNQNSGLTGSFANKIAVTNPAVYKQIKLNNVDTLDIASLNVVPDGYKLYDANYDNNGNATKGATYTVTINSNTTGKWDITSVKGDQTTYVMQYDPSNSAAYSNKTAESSNTLDYTHTVVWFAVVWTVGAYPDSVVIDYGLPVEISVLTNDMFGDYGSLAGVGDYNTEGLTETGHTPSNVLSSQNYTGTFGTATADTANGKIRYELNKSNGMQMNTYEKFGYAVDYKGSNSGYYYSSVTVIPATTIYYEDNFLDFASYHTVDEDKDSVADTYVENGMTMVKYEKDTTSAWTLEGNGVSGATQSEDRPGKYALQDANNIYGYDGVNKGMSMHSLNQARKVYVSENSYATASFQFAGTGFDVISMTSNTTGAIAVQVKAAENIVVNNTQKYAKGAVVKSFFVNTYYGYTQGDDGEWVATPDVAQAIYQVPVLQVENLDYGKYDVTITATYSEYLDKTNAENGKKGYDLYLDAVRIYDPANDGAQDNDTVIEDAYKADGEGWPSYIELRNKLIAADTILGNYGTEDEPITGVVFIDGDGTVGNDQIADYISYGPNNEVYLAPGQRVAFMLSNVKNNGNIAGIHVGIKSADGKTCKYTIANYAQNDTEGGASAGDMYHEKISTVDTTTDMYYDLTDWRNDIIVISNTGSEGILSLTNIKATYKNNPNGTVATGDGNENDGIMVASELDETSGNEVDVYMTPRAAMLTLRSMNAPAEEEIPEPSVPETSEPEETLPEETKPGKPGKDEKPGKPSKPGKDEKPGKPGKDEKPGKPGKDEKPGKPGKDEKPGKPGKDEKPGKPGKDEKPGKAKKG